MEIINIYKIILIVFIIFIPISVHAQGIFVPVEPTSDQSTSNANDTTATDTTSPMMKLVMLQAGLYDVVYSFDDRAHQVEKVSQPFEAAWLRKQEINALQGTNYPVPEELPGMMHYNTLVTEPSLCTVLNNAVGQYIRTHADDLSTAVSQLVSETKKYTDSQKIEMAQSIQQAMSIHSPHTRRAEEIIYMCLYKLKNEVDAPRNFNFEKTMRSWFIIQKPLLDLWLGPID